MLINERSRKSGPPALLLAVPFLCKGWPSARMLARLFRALHLVGSVETLFVLHDDGEDLM